VTSIVASFLECDKNDKKRARRDLDYTSEHEYRRMSTMSGNKQVCTDDLID